MSFVSCEYLISRAEDDHGNQRQGLDRTDTLRKTLDQTLAVHKNLAASECSEAGQRETRRGSKPGGRKSLRKQNNLKKGCYFLICQDNNGHLASFFDVTAMHSGIPLYSKAVPQMEDHRTMHRSRTLQLVRHRVLGFPKPSNLNCKKQRVSRLVR